MPRPIPPVRRIAYDPSTGCWNWKGGKTKQGYGKARFLGKFILAHQLAAKLWLRKSPSDARQVLHRCDNPSCFNPKHLFLGTQVDNMADCRMKGRRAARPSHCPKGHPYDELNTRFRKNRNSMDCRACDRLREERRSSRCHTDPEFRRKRMDVNNRARRARRARLRAVR